MKSEIAEMDLTTRHSKKGVWNNDRYAKRMAILAGDGHDVERIKTVVEQAVVNINENKRSFVIYGEPQSGKTEMMIVLTSKLLDEGIKIIVILLNDSVQLLRQNLERFQRSGLSPSPKKFSEILFPEVNIDDLQWVIFCKKNALDLQKLIHKLEDHQQRAVIDDEADFATPNSRVNKNEKSRINELTEQLIGESGIYIGVTATPARLDLNKTHHNHTENWIDFPPHPNYVGQDIFFPVALDKLKYRLTFLPDTEDEPKHLREAIFGFMVNVAYLNTRINKTEVNYSILIHTSWRKADHTIDYKLILNIFETLKDEGNSLFEHYFNRISEIAGERYPGEEEMLTDYVTAACFRNNIVVMNSDKDINTADNRTATEPAAPFTIIIGGNIVSRGVTFNNLLSMYFTRDVKHKLQQDTYIQRARMFGSRANYIRFFELTIPRTLYLDWQKCFIFHRLSFESRKANKMSPIWLDGGRISVVSDTCIDKTNVVVNKGEMSFGIFDFEPDRINALLNEQTGSVEKMKKLASMLGNDALPDYLVNYIGGFCPDGNDSLALHYPKPIATQKPGPAHSDAMLKTNKFPKAMHHIYIVYNDRNKARIFYKYQGNVRFLESGRN